MKETKFLICEHCKNLVGVINNGGVPMMCCGQKMTELVPDSVDSSPEKHTPVVTVENDKVIAEIGSVPHPMSEEHSIMWVYLQTDKGGQRKNLKADGKPRAEFALLDEKPLAVYAYCNIHGLRKTEISTNS